MPSWLKQSTEVTVRFGPYLDKTDGVSEEVGLAGGATELSKNGAAFGAGPTLGTHDAEGWYPITLTTTHTNTLGSLIVKAHDSATHLPVWREFEVVPAVVYDSLIAGTDTLTADVTQFGGTNGTFASGRPEVNSTHWAGTAVGSTTVRADLINVAGAAVNTATAQLGVNVVNFGGSAGTFAAGRPEVNASHWGGTAVGSTTVRSDLINIAGAAVDATSAQLGVNVVNFGGSAGTFASGRPEVNTSHVAGTAQTARDLGNALPAAAPGVANGLLISGSNAGTTTFGAFTVTGACTISNGLFVNRSTNHSPAVVFTGTGNNGAALRLVAGTGTTAHGLDIVAGSTTGNAIKMTTTSGTGIDFGTSGGDNPLDTDMITQIWAHATRELTSAANITSTGGTTVPQTGDAFARLGAPAGASVSADVAAVKVDTAAILADTGTDGVVVAAGSKTGYSLASSGMDSVTLPANIITATSIAANAFTDGKFNTDAFTKVWTQSITESYGTDGSAHTGAQLAYLILAHVGEFAISGTTKTLKKLDGSTTAATYTLDSSTTPTSITRAT